MRVLVTGGAGFIGSHVVDRLLADGHEVWVLDDLSTGRRGNLEPPRASLHFVQGSVVEAADVEGCVAQVDAVCHLAAAVGVPLIVRDPLAGIRTNVEGTFAVVRACVAHRRPLLFASTSEVYGKTPTVPMGEDDARVVGPTRVGRWSYAAAKALDEHLVLETGRSGLPVGVVRYFNAYGPRLAKSGYGSVVAAFIGRALSGEPLRVYGDGLQTRCFTYVEDSARATVRALEVADTSGEQVLNVGATFETTVLDLAERVLRLTGSRSTLEHVPHAEVFGASFEDPPRRVPDIGRARKVLGWQPEVDLDEGLRRTIAWWREAC